LKTSLELLAPAKNLACGIAAIDHGADAVYIGAERFGARVAAGNSIDDIRQLCDYAHQFSAKVFVTVNTLFYDDELSDVQQLICQLYDIHVDAILVQDMRILDMQLPPITLHASTQTDNRTADKVRWLAGQGFSRVVLARELTVDEIAAIHREVPAMPLEVFVHGALCVSYSGLCYASEYCFGRSANRGACAQFCRMPFDLVDADDQEWEHQRYLLSLKDMNQSDSLGELIEAGATSFKIEGRLKDVAYVKNVVAAYSQRLNDYIARHPDQYCRASAGHVTYTFTPNLEKTFNRGYTHYFLHGRKPDIFSPDTPKAIGEYVGTVKELRRDSLTVAGIASFANGDGLCFLTDDRTAQPGHVRQLTGFRVNRAVGNRLYPYQMPAGLRPGMALYRNSDQDFDRVLSKPSAVRKIPITLRLEVTDDGYALTAFPFPPSPREEMGVSITCPHQLAAKPQRDNIIRQLSRLGDTPYECSRVELPDDFPYFIPNSLLAELRRKCLVIPTPAPSRGEGGENDTLCTSSPLPRGGAATGPLMQCRHCLRYSLGYCPKHGGRRAPWREPLYLRLGDGRRFRLEFDCQHCQMNVVAGFALNDK